MYYYEELHGAMSEKELAQATKDILLATRTQKWAMRLLEEVERLRLAREHDRQRSRHMQEIGPL